MLGKIDADSKGSSCCRDQTLNQVQEIRMD